MEAHFFVTQPPLSNVETTKTTTTTTTTTTTSLTSSHRHLHRTITLLVPHNPSLIPLKPSFTPQTSLHPFLLLLATSNKAFEVIRKAVAELRHGKNVRVGGVNGVQNANAIKS
ncbi:hypothetical protein M0802_005014 [Mischocyttarus mexicanus]|nr:hypothetical protein M0802_015015 [Mischocyttarus mexicanus]KAI4499758.1 hypothetical protein M0802_005014 [Mischocyttarus mexicanus]